MTKAIMMVGYHGPQGLTFSIASVHSSVDGMHVLEDKLPSIS